MFEPVLYSCKLLIIVILTLWLECILKKSLYLYSDDYYFSLGIRTLCEEQGVFFYSLNDDSVDAKLVINDRDNNILFIDAEGISLKLFDYLVKISKFFECKYIAFDRLGGLNDWVKQSAGRYISKKFDDNYFELVLQNKAQSKKVDLTPQEVILLNALAKGKKPGFFSSVRGLDQKSLYQRRKRILDKCGFEKHTPRNVLSSYYLYHIQSA